MNHSQCNAVLALIKMEVLRSQESRKLRHIDDAGKHELDMWHEYDSREWPTGFWCGKLK